MKSFFAHIKQLMVQVLLVDADKRTRKELFDNDKMARWLTEITKDPYDGKHLPKFNFKFSDDGKSFPVQSQVSGDG